MKSLPTHWRALRPLRWAAWLVAALLLLSALAWAGVPPLVRAMAQTDLSQRLGRDVRIAAVHFNPWTMALQVDGFSVAASAATAPGQPVFELRKLVVDADLRSLWRRAPVIDAVRIESPRLRLTRLSDGHYDIDDILQKLAQRSGPAADTAPARFAVYNVSIVDGELSFDDRPAQRVHRVQALNLGLPFISNLPDDVEVKVEPRLAFRLDGTAFDTGAQATPFARDRAGRVTLATGDIDLGEWLPYLPAGLPVRPASGFLSADLAVDFSAPAAGATAARAMAGVSLKGRIALRDFAWVDGGGATLLQARSLKIGLRDVRPLVGKIALGAIELDGAQLNLQRDSQGVLNVAQAFAGPAESPLAAPASPPSAVERAASNTPGPAPSGSAPVAGKAPDAAPAWQVTLDTLDVRQAAVQWTDRAVKPQAGWALQDLQLHAGDLAWPLPASGPPTQVQAQWHWAGTAPVSGNAGTAPVPGNAGTAPVSGNAGAAADAMTADARLPPAAQTAAGGLAEVRLDARVAQAGGQASLSVQRLPLRLFAPYAASALLPAPMPALDGTMSLDGQATWTGAPGAELPLLRISQLGFDNVRLADDRLRSPGKASAAFKRFAVADAVVDLVARRVSVASVSLVDPELGVARDAQGRLNLLDDHRTVLAAGTDASATTVAAAPATASAAAPASAPQPAGWRVAVQDIAVTGGRLHWRDAAVPGDTPAALDVTGLRVAAKSVQWPEDPKQPMRLQGAAQLTTPSLEKAPEAAMDKGGAGKVEWAGQLALQPVAWQGKVRLDRLPLHAFDPYLAAASPVMLLRADASWSGDVRARMAADGPTLDLRGQAQMTDLRAQARQAGGDTGDDLLSWHALGLKDLHVALAPGQVPQVEIGDASLSDLFARLVVTEKGRLNLTDLAPAEPGASAPAAAASAPGVQVAAAASSPAASAPPALSLSLGGVQLVNGRIDFSDRFIRPNYSAALSELNGRLGAFRTGSPDMATLELHGKAAGTAVLDIRGALNPMADPLALDIQARATELELAPLSPYAGKYAGYAIERGKLTMAVQYRLQPDGQLNAKNQVVLNQLTFGDRIESPDATKLPVLLAVALLKDRNGVIDLNLPIGGSINDPQFSVGGLIVKVIVNLLVKAVTAPFALLSGGGADDLSVVECAPGTPRPTAAAQAAIDKVATALTDRPALKMTITGASDPQAERDAIQAAALEARVLAEQRKDALRAGATVDAELPALSEAERARLVKRVYGDTKLPNKPRNAIGMAKDLTVPEMEALLKAAVPVTADTARELALQRGVAVRDALIAKGLSNERLFLSAPKVGAAGEGAAAAPGVQLTLSTR